jgi:predicted permease
MPRWILDARFAVRRMTHRPLAALVAMLTLALGVGGMAAIAGLTRSLLARPLPYPHAEQLVRMWRPGAWRGKEIAALDGAWSGFTSVAAYRPRNMTLEHPGAPTRVVPGISSSADLFRVMQVSPALGHAFARGDDRPGAAPVAVLSNALWRELGADPHLPGSSLTLDGTSYIVVGVMPEGFWFPDPSIRLWTNDTINATSGVGLYTLVGRLEPGRHIQEMGVFLDRVTTILGQRFTYEPQWDLTRNATLTSFPDWMLGPLHPAIVAMLIGMGAILLIACANVGALIIGQIEGRSAELAVRTALGAGRGRIATQLIIEVLALGAGAAVLGSAFATVSFHRLRQALPLGVWGERATLDWSLFAASIAVAIGAALVIAVLPVLMLWRGDLQVTLAGARGMGPARRGNHVQSALVICEVALGVVLACSAGLLGRSVANRYAIHPGLRTDGVAVLDVATPLGMNTADRRGLIRHAIAALSAVPGVQHVAVTQMLPLRGRDWTMGLDIPGRDLTAPTPFFRMVSADYFATLGIPLRSGRLWDASDHPEDSVKAIIVSASLAHFYFPGVDPVGRVMPGGFGAPERIVGVVADAAEGDLTDHAAPTRYYLNDQVGFVPAGQTFMVAFAKGIDVSRLLGSLRQTVSTAAPSAAVQGATSMNNVLALAIGPAREVMLLLGWLTSLALILGTIGVYGVLSQFVSRRLRDWSLRVALGLTPARLMTQIVRRGAMLVLLGVAVGLGVTAVAARLLSAFFFGVTATDPLTLLGSGALLLLVGVAATLVPAFRAGRADPAAVLRGE